MKFTREQVNLGTGEPEYRVFRIVRQDVNTYTTLVLAHDEAAARTNEGSHIVCSQAEPTSVIVSCVELKADDA